MRRLTWCCVIGAVLGAGVGIGWSQDRAPFAARRPSEFAPRTVSKPKAAPRTPRKSYYAELFGAEGAAQENPQPLENPVEQLPSAPAAPEEQFADPPRSGTVNFIHGVPETQAAGGVVYAEFEQNPEYDESNKIVQVAGQRIVRPARRPRDTESPLSTPIAIPAQAETGEVEPLFEAAPAPPQDDPSDTFTNTSVPSVRSGGRPPAPPIDAGAPPAPPLAATTAAPAAPAVQSPNIRVAWNKQGEVTIGRECRCQLVLENTGAAAAQNLEVVALFSPNARLLNSNPPAASTEPSLVWEIAELAAAESQTIEITLMPLGPGEISTQAEVRYSTAVSSSFQVAEPKLALRLSGPAQTMLGEAATQTILISNPGTGVTGNVQIAARIPTGLEHARGGELLMEIGALHPGETRSVRLPLAAVSGGRHVVQVEARADGGLVQQASCAVSVVAPQMESAIQGPALRYIGRRAAYTIVVANDGSVPSENVRVMHKVPEGFEFVNADNGGQFDSGTQLLNWFVGHMEPGQTVTLAAAFECEKIGEFTHFVRSVDDQGAVSDTQITTTIQGTPRLSMSIRDLDDPVETGVETAYEVEVKNEGSAAAQRVQLTCELPESVSLINVTGPLAYRDAAGVLAFSPLAQLGPGETATVRIHVRSAAAGNLKLRAQLTSDSIDEPLVEEEVTKFYGE